MKLENERAISNEAAEMTKGHNFFFAFEILIKSKKKEKLGW